MMAPLANTHVEEGPDCVDYCRVVASGAGDMATSLGAAEQSSRHRGHGRQLGGTIQQQQEKMCHDRNVSNRKRMILAVVHYQKKYFMINKIGSVSVSVLSGQTTQFYQVYQFYQY